MVTDVSVVDRARGKCDVVGVEAAESERLRRLVAQV